MMKKFRGAFHALTIQGKGYVNDQRFKPLTKKAGKPLWEFKEHDHRLYCARIVHENAVVIILLHGWSKDKKGPSREEDQQIAVAMGLYQEYLAESNRS